MKTNFIKNKTMLKNILKVNGVTELDKNTQKFINGGQGNCFVQCNSGARIGNAPNSSDEVADHACQNQGGATFTICVGEEQPWIR